MQRAQHSRLNALVGSLLLGLPLGATALAMAPSHGINDPSQPVAELQVQLEFWSGSVRLFPDYSAELSTGESLGKWSNLDGPEGPVVSINMGTYSDGYSLDLSFAEALEVGDIGVAMMFMPDGSIFGGTASVADMEPAVFIGPPDDRYRACPGSEHPPGDPIIEILKRKRGKSFAYIVKTQSGEYLITTTLTSPNSGEGWVQIGKAVYWVCWKGKV